MPLILIAVILGIVEGVTEFLPVSSTGHLILATALLKEDPARWAAFNVFIQLGAILAIVVLYWRTFWDVATGLLGRDGGAWRFVRNILLAFMPSAVLGLAFHSKIELLLSSTRVVAWALIVGGVAILLIERMAKRIDVTSVSGMPVARALGIGAVQCVAMIPGVSRSGATIMGALLMGVDRKTAAEFSFFLAIPTMVGASALELVKAGHELSSLGAATVASGFVTSFIVALIVVKLFVAFVTRHGFAPFAWYRILAGGVALIMLA